MWLFEDSLTDVSRLRGARISFIASQSAAMFLNNHGEWGLAMKAPHYLFGNRIKVYACAQIQIHKVLLPPTSAF